MKFQIFGLLYAIGYVCALNYTPYIQLPPIMWGGLVLFGIIVMLTIQFEPKRSAIFLISIAIVIASIGNALVFMKNQQDEIVRQKEQLETSQRQLMENLKSIYHY